MLSIVSLTCYTLKQLLPANRISIDRLLEYKMSCEVKYDDFRSCILLKSGKWKLYHKKLSKKKVFLPFKTELFLLCLRWEFSRPVPPSSGIFHLFDGLFSIWEWKEAEEKQENLLLSLPSGFLFVFYLLLVAVVHLILSQFFISYCSPFFYVMTRQTE